MRRPWTMALVAMAAAWVVGGCGGSEKPVENVAAGDDDGQAQAEGTSEEQLDELERLFDRKASIIARCFGDAFNAGEIKKDASIIVTVTTTINTNGSASGTEIEKSTTDSPAFKACVIRYIESWDYPKVAEPTKFSHIYRIEEF